MRDPFDPRAWYTARRDGPLDEYLEVYDGHNAFPLFRGYRHYKMLWDRGYFIPNFSVIRVMWNIGRDDEHFLVTGEYSVAGIWAPAHAGRDGVHDPRKLLNPRRCPPWEAQHMSLDPQPRKKPKTS